VYNLEFRVQVSGLGGYAGQALLGRNLLDANFGFPQVISLPPPALPV
jgi:hypothetical protein